MKQSQQPQQPQEEWWYKHECGIQQPELMDEDTPLLERAVAWMRRKYYAIIDHYVDKEVKHARRKFDRGRRLRFEQLEPRCMLNGMGIDAPQWDSPLTPPTGALDVFESAYYANDIAISQDQEEMAIASRDAGIHILNAKTATDIQTLSGHTANVIDTEYSADGKLLASVSYDRTLRIWDNETKCQIKSIPLASLGTAVQFSPDSQLVAAGVHETGILIHDIQTGAQVIVPYSNDCARFAFSTDSSTMAFADSGKVKLYDISSGQIVREFSGTTAAIYSLDINPSGTLVAAGDRAGTVCIWDIATGELLSSTKDHCGAPTAASGVLSVVFQKGEGKHLITADYSGLVIVKNIEESTAPVEIARYQTQGPCCVVSYPTGEAFLANNEVNGKGRGAAYPLPLTPAVPDPVTEPETPTEEPEATAVPALTKLQTLRSTLASAEGSTVGIAAQNLLQEIIITCGEQPDTTTLATFASSLEERRQLLLEADVLTTLLQEQSADATTLTMLKTSTALQRAINDHRIASLNSFLSLMEAGTATAEDCGSFLRCSTDALDLAALGSGKEWVGAIHTDSETNTRIVHVKQGTAPALQNDALPLSSTLTGIDFSQNGHLVTSARLKLTFTGTAPSVKAYRDGKVIGTYTPDAGGYVQIFDLQGITHLIVTHSASSTAILEEMTVQSDVGVPSGGSRALGAGTSREIALAMAPTAASWKAYVIKSRAGDIRIDPTKYTMVSVHGYTKNATIGSIQYYDHKYGNTTKTLPNEFITKLDAYTWIIHPGAPECLKVAVNGATIWNYGSKGYQWEYSQTVQAGQTSQELLPSGPMRLEISSLDFDVVSSSNQRRIEWLEGAPSQMQQHQWPVGTGDFWFEAFIQNTGGVGGQVKIELFGVPSPYDGSSLGSPQQTLTVTLAAGQSKLLHGWATIPNATETGSIIARITYPDGHTQLINVAATAEHRDMNFTGGGDGSSGTEIVNPYSESEQNRILRAQMNLADALGMQGNMAEQQRVLSGIPIAVSGGAGSETIAASVRSEIVALGIDIPAPTVVATEEEMNLLGNATIKGIQTMTQRALLAMADTSEYLAMIDTYGGDIGGAELDMQTALTFVRLRNEVLAEGTNAAYSHLLSLYQAGRTANYPAAFNQDAASYSVAGRMFMGLVQNIGILNDMDMQKALTEAEAVLGVSPERLWNAARNHSSTQFGAALQQQFENCNFGHLFANDIVTSSEGIIGVRTDKDSYSQVDTSMKVYFDFNGTTYDHAAIYLMDENGNALNAQHPLVTDIRGKLFVEVPLSAFTSVLSTDSVRGNFQVKIAVWKNPGDIQGLQGSYLSTPFGVKYSGGGSETSELVTTEKLSDDPVENAILNEIAHNFPLEGNVSDWRWVIGSNYHYGSDYNAIDLNLGAGDTDYGKEIKAVGNGTITSVGTAYGSVRIAYEITVNEQKITWYGAALHMPIYATNRTAANGKIIYEIRNEDGTVAHEIFEGMTVKTGQEFGIVGGRGTQKDGTLNDHLFSAHSHLEYSVAGHNIDLRTLVASWGIKNVVAQDETSKEIPVRWDSNTGLWMSDALGLAFDRSSQLGTSKIFGSWIAWSTDPAQRQQVKWDSNNNGWFWWDTTTNDWKRNSINERLKWMKMNDVFAFQSAQ